MNKLEKGKLYYIKLKAQRCGLIIKVNGYGKNYAEEDIIDCVLVEDRRRGSVLQKGQVGHVCMHDIEKYQQIPDSQATLYYLDSDLC